MANEKNYKHTLHLYNWMYAVALAAVALVSVVSQMLIQNYLTNQISDTHLINYAAKLRTESQTLVKYALLLEAKQNVRGNLKDYSKTLRLLEHTQKSLRYGNEFMNIPENTNKDIEALFVIIDRRYMAMLESAHQIRELVGNDMAGYNITESVKLLLNEEKAYLLGMEMIVFEYDRLLSNNIKFLKKLEWILLCILLLCLAGEALLIFLPLSGKLRDSFLSLAGAEMQQRELVMEVQQINHELEESKLSIIQHHANMQKVKSELIIMGQERERKRIAAEIHDGVGQMLTALKMKVGMMEDSMPGNGETFSEVNDLLSAIVGETRKICSQLLPSVLDDFGLKAATSELVKGVRSSSAVDVNVRNSLDESLLSPEQSVSVYRIIQEALNNICKHSGASTVEILMESDAEMIFVAISDNGIGFEMNMERIRELRMMGMSYGLVNMKERADLLGGKLNINTRPSHGTSVELTIPLIS